MTSACSCLIASASSAVSCERRRSRIARRLDRAELEALDELLARGVAVARGADQLDDRVEVVERDEQALEDVRARLLLGELVLGAADDHLALVGDVVVDHRAQVQRARHVVDERDHVDAERGLHRRVLVELVEHDLRDRVALELDHQAHAALVGLVAQVGDLGDLLVVDEVGDLLDQAAVAALLDHERQLGDDDRLLALRERLDVRARLHAHAPAAGLVGVADALAAEDDPAGREVRALDVRHQPVDRRSPGRRCRRSSRAITSRRLCGGMFVAMPTAMPGGAVDEQVREARRQHERLAACEPS